MHGRKVINVEVDKLDIDGLTLSAAIKELDRLSGIHGTGATIDLQNSPYDEGQYWAVFKYVPETDEQMNQRMKKSTLLLKVQANVFLSYNTNLMNFVVIEYT